MCVGEGTASRVAGKGTSASLSPTMYKEKGWKWLGIGCATLSLYLERLPKAQIWYLNENHRAPASL